MPTIRKSNNGGNNSVKHFSMKLSLSSLLLLVWLGLYAALLLNEIRHKDENSQQLDQHHSPIHKYLYESKASSLSNALRGSSSISSVIP